MGPSTPKAERTGNDSLEGRWEETNNNRLVVPKKIQAYRGVISLYPLYARNGNR